MSAHDRYSPRFGAAPRIVLDTSVWVDAYFHEDLPSQQLLEHIDNGRIIHVFSNPIEEEVLATLSAHFADAHVPGWRIALFMRKAVRTMQRGQRIETSNVFFGCSDKDDNKFFDCAICAKAHCIVTADSDISGVSEPPVSVLSAWQFLAACKNQKVI